MYSVSVKEDALTSSITYHDVVEDSIFKTTSERLNVYANCQTKLAIT